MSRKTLILSNVLLALFAATAWACLWDNDTLQMERLRFPGVLEIITGKFVRHSRAYYEWRILDRKMKLATQPGDPALLDDLAVAYAKLGRPEEGIALLEPTLADHPNRYETLSNLGTLLFFAGRLDESKDYLRRALEINPNAHFGRERYQLLLTEYLQQSDLDSEGVMSVEGRYPNGGVLGFARFVIVKQFGDENRVTAVGMFDDDKWSQERMEEIHKAAKGVLGMMHFADFQSPVLLEALGDLLIAGNGDVNDTLLAARAYLRAAQVSKDSAASKRFELMARQALINHQVYSPHMDENQVDLKRVTDELERERSVADAWFKSIETNEHRWIADNKDVDREFASVYYISLDETISTAKRQSQNENLRHNVTFIGGYLFAPLAAIAALAAGIVFWIRRSRRVSASKTALSKPLHS